MLRPPRRKGLRRPVCGGFVVREGRFCEMKFELECVLDCVREVDGWSECRRWRVC